MSEDSNQNERLTKVETCMQYIQKEMGEIKELIKEFKNDFKIKDTEYNKKFATKKELETAQQLDEKSKLLSHPIVWVIVTTIIISFANIFAEQLKNLLF